MDKEYFDSIFQYDMSNGKLYWKERNEKMFESPSICKMWNKRFAGKEAGNLNKGHGYISIGLRTLNKKNWLAHHIIFCMMTGRLPEGEIDHIDHNRINNKWDNLREVPRKENARNHSKKRNNTSGYTGVYKTENGNYIARVWHIDRKESLGTYKTPEEANEAYRNAISQLGFHENHGL